MFLVGARTEILMQKLEHISVKVKRQDNTNSPSYWETFQLQYRPYMNVITVLQDIRKNPRTFDGRLTSPITWESSCLEEVCGTCTMVINGKVRQSCSTLVDSLGEQITIEPMTKFPVVRDLIVDRGILFKNLKRVKAWVPIDGTYALGAGPKMSPEDALMRYELSRCIACGCCMDACPQINDRSDFVGAAVINQVRLFNSHPTGEVLKKDRLKALMGKGGIEDCGNAQNCVKACPKSIPLVTSIVEVNRQITLNIFDLLKK